MLLLCYYPSIGGAKVERGGGIGCMVAIGRRQAQNINRYIYQACSAFPSPGRDAIYIYSAYGSTCFFCEGDQNLKVN